jgi:hypothetical protein
MSQISPDLNQFRRDGCSILAVFGIGWLLRGLLPDPGVQLIKTAPIVPPVALAFC